MSFIINPNKYKFTTSQDIVITYESAASLDYGYLYGLDGVINSKTYNQKTLTFPPFAKEGTYSNCYIGTYVGDEWVQSDYFTIEISNATPPPIDNPPFVNNISNKNTLVNQSVTISYTATDDKGISNHEFSDNGGSSYTIINPTKNGDVYSFTKSYSSTGNRTCKIRITDTNNQKSESNSFTIYVTSSNVLVESVSVNPSSGVINVGETLQLTATVSPSNATNQNIRWDSLNGDILSVNSNGLVTGISEGSGWIRAMSQDGSSKFKDVRMTINPGSSNVSVSGVNISPKTLNLNVGNSGQLNHTITPSNATNQNITYSSSNDGIATVDNNGLVNAISQGSCVTTATTQDGNQTDTCNVTVSNVTSTNTPPNIGSVLVNNENYDGTYTLTYNVTDKENDNISHELKIGSDNYKSINPIKSNSTYKYNGSGLGIGVHTGQIRLFDGKTTVISNQFTIRINEKPASVKAELKLAKDDYDTKHKALKDTINSIILDNKFDKDTERTLLDNAFSNYNSSLAKYKEVSQKAIDSISQKKADNVKVEIDRDIEDLNNALGDLEGTINGALSDGILSDAEKISIKQHLQIISREKIDIDKQYEVVYINEDLIGNAKNNLKISYDTYNTKYLNLVNTINEIVNKVGVLDSTDQNNLNNAFNEYKNASADYSKRVNEAIDAIAKKKAEDAELNAKKHTEAQIKIVDDSIKSKVSQETYDKNNKVITEKFTEVNQTVSGINETVVKIENDYTTSTEFNRTLDDINMKFGQTGGTNEIRNSKCLNSTDFMYTGGHTGNPIVALLKGHPNIQFTVKNYGASGGFQTASIPVISGENHTIAFDYVFERGMENYIEIHYYSTEHTGFGTWPDVKKEIPNNRALENKGSFLYTTTVPEGAKWMKFYIYTTYNGVDSSKYPYAHAYIDDFRCFRGNIAGGWQPHSEEMYAANIKFDKNGIEQNYNNNFISRWGASRLEFLTPSGIRKLAIDRSQFCTYNFNDGNFLSYFGATQNASHSLIFGNALSSSRHCAFFDVSHNPNILDDSLPIVNANSYFRVNFFDYDDQVKGTHVYKYPLFVHNNLEVDNNLKVTQDLQVWGDIRAERNINAKYIICSSGIDMRNMSIENLYATKYGAGTGAIVKGNGVVLELGGQSMGDGGGLGLGCSTSTGDIQRAIWISSPSFVWNYADWNWGGHNIYDVRVHASLALDSKEAQLLKDTPHAEVKEDTLYIDPVNSCIELVKENNHLKDEVVTSMLASTEMFEMMLAMTPQTLNSRSVKANENIIKVYASLVNKKEKSIEEIPEILRQEVELKLKTYPE